MLLLAALAFNLVPGLGDASRLVEIGDVLRVVEISPNTTYQPQLDIPVFLHGATRPKAAQLIESGTYSKNDRAKLGQGLYTTAYLPVRGQNSSESAILSGRKGTYRKYVFRAKYTRSKYPRLVAFQMNLHHNLKIAVVPRSLHDKEDLAFESSCQGFDAFCVPNLEGVGGECSYMNALVERKTSCTELSIEQVLAAIRQDCIQEVKWNWVDGQAKIPDFFNTVFFATNNPYTSADQIVSFCGLNTKEERDRRVTLANKWSDLDDWNGLWYSEHYRYRLLPESKEKLKVKVYKGGSGELAEEDLRSDNWILLTCSSAMEGGQTVTICEGQYDYQHHRSTLGNLARKSRATVKLIRFKAVGNTPLTKLMVQDIEASDTSSDNVSTWTELKSSTWDHV